MDNSYTVVAFIVTVRLVWKSVNIQLGNVMLIKVTSHHAIPGISCKKAMKPPFSAMVGRAYTVAAGGCVCTTTSVAAMEEDVADMTATVLLDADMMPINQGPVRCQTTAASNFKT